MLSPKKGKLIIDIDESIELLRDIMPSILEAYLLTGGDAVCSCFGTGKQKVITTLRDRKTSELGSRTNPYIKLNENIPYDKDMLNLIC